MRHTATRAGLEAGTTPHYRLKSEGSRSSKHLTPLQGNSIIYILFNTTCIVTRTLVTSSVSPNLIAAFTGRHPRVDRTCPHSPSIGFTHRSAFATNLHTRDNSYTMSAPTPSEPEAAKQPSGTNPNATTFTPGKFDWADEVTTPTAESDQQVAGEKKSEEQKTEENSQKDGATSWLNGSGGLDEPEFDVKVTLADLQDDPNNPLYSVKTFDDLNL